MSALSPDKTKDAGQNAAASSGKVPFDYEDLPTIDYEDLPTIISKMEKMEKMDRDEQSYHLFKLGFIIKCEIHSYANGKVSHTASDDLEKLADNIHTAFNIYEKLDGIKHESLDAISEKFDGLHKRGLLDGIIKCDSVQQGIKQAGDLNELKQRMERFGFSGVSDDSIKKLFGKDGIWELNRFTEDLMESNKTLKNILKQEKEDIVKMMSSANLQSGPVTGKMDDTKAKLGDGEK